MADERERFLLKDISVISILQLTITAISSLFANYLLTNVSFISNPTLSFKIFVLVYSFLSLVILLSKTKARWTFLKLPFFIGSCTLIIYVVAVLYGAPLLSKTDETMTFGLVMAVLCILPPCCFLGANIDELKRVFTSNWLECTAESYFQCCVALTVFGAWLGAFPIPLDWDRPWQVWPITCVIGGLLGNTLGVSVTGFIFYCTSEKRRKDL